MTPKKRDALEHQIPGHPPNSADVNGAQVIYGEAQGPIAIHLFNAGPLKPRLATRR